MNRHPELGRVESLAVAFQEGLIPGVIGHVRVSLASITIKGWVTTLTSLETAGTAWYPSPLAFMPNDLIL